MRDGRRKSDVMFQMPPKRDWSVFQTVNWRRAEIDQLEIRCLADANPPASILWKKSKSPGVTEVAGIGESLLFSPIYRNHAAVYICEAANTEGESIPVSVQVSVNCKYSLSYLRLDLLYRGKTATIYVSSERSVQSCFENRYLLRCCP